MVTGLLIRRPGRSALLVGWLMALAAVGCKPEFSERASQVLERRIVAAQAVPAETQPRVPVAYHALVVGPTGAEPTAPIDWAYCTKPKPVSDLNDVARECFVLTADYLRPLDPNGSPDVAGTVPSNACRQFGPDPPEAEPGQPPGRPTDPDGTGGFYQPLRMLLADDDHYLLATAVSRVTCGLPDATGALANEYGTRYRPNQNPIIETVSALGAGQTQPVILASDEAAVAAMQPPPAPLVVPRGAPFAMRTTWPACPTTPACGNLFCEAAETIATCPADCPSDGTQPGCGGAETYAYHDLVNKSIVDRSESMRVAWLATAGSFAEDHTGRTEAEASIPYADNTWTAPDTAGPVFMWIVLRDDRGGVTWQSYRLDVQ